ncbi:LamG domain-containing protein, partial [bacterium]|nr:LamG domain-containing protein [bacterium]
MEIKIKRGTSTYLSETNPVLAAGEPCLETDTRRIKYGDGATPWNSLAYANPNVKVDGGELSAPAPGSEPGEFTPPAIEGLALWLDGASRFEGFVSVVGSGVSQWLDKSPEKNSFFQSLKENRPANSGTINGLGVVTFDGDNDAMLASFKLPPQCTVFVVMKRNGDSANGKVFTATRADGSEFSFCATEDGSSFGVLADGEYLAVQEVADMTTAMYGLTVSETSLTTRLNGLSTQTAEYSNDSRFKSFSIGSSRSNYSSGAFGGDLAEIVVYDHVLTDTERQQVDAYLLGRWGITQVVHPLLDGMVAFWPMNEENGDRLDISGGNALVETGAVESSPGVIGNACELAGGENYLSHPTLKLTPSFTISGWFKSPTTTGMFGQLMQNWDGAEATGQFLLGWGDEPNQSTTNELLAYIKTGDGLVRLAYPALAADEWRHFVLSLDADMGMVSLYVDNVLADSSPVTSALVSTTNVLQLGIGEQGNSQNSTACSLDSVGVWDRALSESEIGMLWNGGFGRETFEADLYGDNVSLLLHMNRLPNVTVATGTDPYWDNVSLLMHMDGDFLDSSVNGLTVTANGDATTSTAQSKFGGASGYFDGASDLAAATGPLAVFGNEDFTVEMWVRFDAVTPQFFLDARANDTSNGWAFLWSDATAGLLGDSLYWYTGSENYLAPWTPQPNAWYHIAYTRTGTAGRLFVNGEIIGSFSDATNYVAGMSLRIGGRFTSDYYTVGYIDDLRITKGVARYTANFTPPETAFPDGPVTTVTMPEVTTSLLLHFDGADGSSVFTDSSSNGLSLPVLSGSPSITTSNSKFGGACLAANGGVIGFSNNSSQPLSNFTGGDFTIEAWIWRPTETGDATIFGCANEGSPGFHFWIDSSLAVHVDNFQVSQFIGGTVPVEQWTHIAAVNQEGTYRVYIDGVLAGSAAGTPGSGPFSAVVIGGWASFLSNTLIDELRITKGQALYVTNFTPPTAPFAGAPVPSLLLKFDGSDGSTTFTDSGPNALTVTANGNAVISTAQSKFGGASGYFNGGNISVEVPPLANQDFTIEFWAYFVTTPAESHILGSHTAFVRFDWLLQVWNGSFRWLSSSDGADVEIIQADEPLTPHQWAHFAVTRSGPVLRMFLDGVLVASGASAASISSRDPVTLMSDSSGLSGCAGYIDNLRIIKGTAVYTSKFTPPDADFVVPQPVPSLLLHFDGTNGSTIFTDSSPNMLSVTANGSAAISTAQSKFGGASVYLPGSGSCLRATGDLAFGTGDFTVEAWLFREGGGTYPSILEIGAHLTDAGIIFLTNTSGAAYSNGWLGQLDIPLNEWVHVAWVRNAGVFTTYLNGVSTGSVAFTHDLTDSGTITIGNRDYNEGNYDFVGYIDELRIIKGQALYTADFNPPAAPFLNPVFTTTGADPYASSVSLLLSLDGENGSTTFADSSSYNHLVVATENGSAQISTNNSKFGGASCSFDGTSGSTIETPANAAFNFGSEDFTVEFWLNATGTFDLCALMSNTSYSIGTGWALWICNNYFTPTRKLTIMFNGVEFVLVTDSDAYVDNEWTHIAVVRENDAVSIYSNGQRIATGTFSGQILDSSSPLMIGGIDNRSWNQNNALDGYMDDIRITKGVARYSGESFTPPDAPFGMSASDTPVTYFYDNSKYHHEITAVGDAQISTSEFKFGNASGKFDGEGDYLTVPADESLSFGTGDFTVEAWIYITGDETADGSVCAGNAVGDWMFAVNVDGDSKVGFGRNDVDWDLLADFSPSAGQWYHIAMSRASGVLRAFVDGSLAGSDSVGFDYGVSDSFAVGARELDGGWGHFFNGHIDDLRVTKGVARYTSAFTPPTRELPDPIESEPVVTGDPYAEDVVLLLHMDGADGSTNFVDNSFAGNTVTSQGGAQITTAQGKFGGTSLDVSSPGKKLVVDAGEPSALGSGDFTIECWLYWTGQISGFYTWGAIAATATAPNPGGWYFLIDTSSNNGVSNALMWIDAESSFLPGTASVPANEWCHIAVVRVAGVIKMYLNGVYCGGGNSPTNINDNLPLAIGADNGEAGYVLGYIDDLRITKGV